MTDSAISRMQLTGFLILPTIRSCVSIYVLRDIHRVQWPFRYRQNGRFRPKWKFDLPAENSRGKENGGSSKARRQSQDYIVGK